MTALLLWPTWVVIATTSFFGWLFWRQAADLDRYWRAACSALMGFVVGAVPALVIITIVAVFTGPIG